MNDFALPPAPSTPAPGFALPGQPVAAPPPQQPQPRGRPLEDPEAQARKVEAHAEASRVGSILPKKALDSKIQIFVSKGGRIPPMARPVCTVLVSELEQAKKAGLIANDDSEEFLRERLTEALERKPNINPDSLFMCRTVDRKGAPIPQFPTFELSLSEDAQDQDESQDDGQDGQDEGQLSEDDDPRYAFPPGGHPVQPPYGTPPAPTPINPAEVEAGVRRDERQRNNEFSSVVMTLMTQLQAQNQQAQDRQNQMYMQLLAQQQAAAANQPKMTEMLAPLLTALSPILVKLLEPKPDSTKDILLPLLIKTMEKKEDPSVATAMLATMPTVMQSILQVQSQAAAQTAETTARAQGMVMDSMVKQVVDLSREMHTRRNEKDDGDDKGGGMGGIAQIAAAVLPALMGGGQQQAPAAAPDFSQQPAALPAPVPQPQQPAAEAPRPRAPKRQAPPVAADPEKPAEPAKPRARRPAAPAPDDNSLIRGCVKTVVKLHDGTIAAEQLWQAVGWIREKAPANMLAAIRTGERDNVLKVGAEAVLADQALLTWISDEVHIEYLSAILDDVRKLDAGQVNDEYAAKRIAEVKAAQPQKSPPAAPPAPAAEKPADPPANPPAQPAAEAPAGTPQA